VRVAVSYWEDMLGQEVTVRMDDGTQVQGHISRVRFEDITGRDTKDQGGRIRFEKTDPFGDYTEGQWLQAHRARG
jgi:hypothetical protein